MFDSFSDDDLASMAWQSFREGIDIGRLVDNPDGSSAALLRYQAGASVPLHRHIAHEHIVVLRGSQGDEYGTYTAGSIVINPPDSQHSVTSKDGCIVYIIWEKAVEMLGEL